MTSKETKLAVIAINNTLSTNNPKGVTDALRRFGYQVDGRFDILNYDALNKALLELYIADPKKWGDVVSSVQFNYQKTDSSTDPNTRATFENLIKSFNPNDNSSTQKGDKPKWWETALNYILGSTTTTHQGTPPPSVAKTSPWVYVGLSIVALAIVGITIYAVTRKSI